MRFSRSIATIVTLATVLVLGPAGVAVADPPAGPMVVAGANFETPSSTLSGIIPVDMIEGPATAWWGRTTSVRRPGGSYGLWCAGTGGVFPTYPQLTRGVGSIATPQDFYTLDLDFWYLMPSLGAADGSSFSVWWETATAPSVHEVRTSLPRSVSASDWRHLAYDLDSPSDSVDLSGDSGSAWFQFFDFVEGGVQNPKVGQGVAIDDITFVGYKYGPVRNLTAASVPSQGVRLTWARPYKSVNDPTSEARTISYRVWRRPQASPASPWLELTLAGRVTDQAATVEYLDDQSVVDGVYYQYVVVAYDSGTGTGYGVSSEVVGRYVAPATSGIRVGVSVTPPVVSTGQPAEFTYSIENLGDSPITGIQLMDWQGVVGSAPESLASLETTTVTRAFDGSSDDFLLNSVEVTGTQGATTVHDQAEIRLEINNPALSVVVDPLIAYASTSKIASFRVTVTNEGDVPIDLSATVDAGGWTENVDSPGLLVGQSRTIAVGAEIVGNATAAVVVDGTCGAGLAWEQTVQDSTSAAARVVQSRFAGASRTETAVKLSQASFPTSAGSVVIATAYGYADALSASALAASVGGPLLLVRTDAVPAEVLTEVARLKAKTAYVIGGTSVVSNAARNQLKAAGLTVVPVAGASRYATAAEVAKRVDALSTSKTVFLATGTNFPDALAASSLAAAMKARTMLTQPTALPAETLAELKTFAPTRVVVCGGTGAVSDAVLSKVRTELGLSVANTPRLAGAGRYETAKKIIDWGRDTAGLAPNGIDGMYLASGTNYPDALAGGVFAANHLGKWRPLMLTNPAATDPVPEVQALVVGNPSMSFVSAIGGTSALPEPLYQKALGYLQ